MKKASIDIGSNSVLLLIIDLNESGEFVELENESRIAALGKNLDVTKCFAKESMDLAYDFLAEYKNLIDKHEVAAENVWVTATEAARVAQNAEDFFAKVKNNLGLQVRIISGEGEAFYTAMGVAKGISEQEDEVTIMDIGGASTEFIKLKNNRGYYDIVDSLSLPVGSVRATDWLGQSEELFKKNISDAMEQVGNSFYTGRLIGVAGTMTCAAAMIFKSVEFCAADIHNYSFTLQDLEDLYCRLKDLSGPQVLEKYPFVGKRSESIVGGVCSVLYMADALGTNSFTISTYGLRYGVLLSEGIDAKFIQL